MKNEGFTLVELLTVIVILSAVSLIGIFTIDGVIKRGSEKAYQTQINEMKSATENFVKTDGLPTWCNLNNNGDVCFITLKLLLVTKYIAPTNGEFKNPATDKPFADDTLIKIEKYGKNYLFEVKDDLEKFSKEEPNLYQRSQRDIASCHDYINELNK